MTQYFKPTLKYALPLLLIVLLVLVSMSGCLTRTSTSLGNVTPSPTPTQVKVNVTAANKGVYVSDNPFIQPKAGNKYVQIYVTVTNVNYPGETIGNQYFFKLFDSKNEGHTPTIASFGEGGLQSISNSNPGQKTAGTLIFEISQSANPVSLNYNDFTNDLTIILGNTTPSPTPTPTMPPTPIVLPLPTQVYVSGPTLVVQGQPATFIATLYSINEHKNVCGAVNYYIDNSAAYGTWNINPAGTCSASSGSLVLGGADTAKLSVGTHTLKVDWLGNNAYGPSQSVMTFTMRSSPTPIPTYFPTPTPFPTFFPTPTPVRV